MDYSGALRGLVKMRDAKTLRNSSYDRTGGNSDWTTIQAGEKKIISNIQGSGCVTHIWMGVACDEPYFLRKIVLRAYWDGEKEPSIEAPLGDFFGMGHGITKNFVSAPFMMSPQEGRGLNCYFAMPFSEGAVFEVENQCSSEYLRLWYYIDYEQYDKPLEPDVLRFHAQWRSQNTQGIDPRGMANEEFCFGGTNTTGDDNYVILEAEGKGHYVGCNFNVVNKYNPGFNVWNWYGEGDDMIFIDGEKWPPSLHGTGMEDYFNTGWCPSEEYNAPYHGIILPGGRNWAGKITYYRYHIQDPVIFHKSIKVTIEHGHANHRSDVYESTAYWYQSEPHMPFPEMKPAEERVPDADNYQMSELH